MHGKCIAVPSALHSSSSPSQSLSLLLSALVDAIIAAGLLC